MLQANPNLTYRDVQEILVRTATQNDQFDGDWVTNGAGFHFNIRYGAGLVNAQAATSTAATWINVAPLQTKEFAQTSLAQAIPDSDLNGTSRTFTVSAADNLRLEHVRVKVKATHPYVGNLQWYLTSPSGVKVRLARARFNDTAANLDWTFTTTHFWGERSEGDWKLELCAGSGGWSDPRPGSPGEQGLPDTQLYNLKEDIAEKDNLQSSEPAIVAKMTAELEKIVTDGRSTPGTPQKNAVEVVIRKKTPAAKAKKKAK